MTRNIPRGGLAHRHCYRDGDMVRRFVTLPAGVRHPEGITANPQTHEIFVGTFDAPPDNQPNKVLRFDRDGQLKAQRDFGPTPLLGLEFDCVGGYVYIVNAEDFAATPPKIQRISANFDASTPIEDVASIPAIGAPGPRSVTALDGSVHTITFGNNAPSANALAFDRHGSLYVSDPFQGAIFRIDNPGPSTSTVVTVSHHPLLASACFPFVGANGIALNHEGSALFIANTGDDSVLKLDLDTNEVTVFAESINGADGLAFDRKGRLWVAANQNDELVALSRDGRVVARVGDFGGLDCDGSHRGLLLPASMVIVEDEMYVTNLALTPTETHVIEEDVRLYTISCISLPWE